MNIIKPLVLSLILVFALAPIGFTADSDAEETATMTEDVGTSDNPEADEETPVINEVTPEAESAE